LDASLGPIANPYILQQATSALSIQCIRPLVLTVDFPEEAFQFSNFCFRDTVPQGTMENASSPPLAHDFAIVCRSGIADTNRWIDESHNVGADYLRAFGKPAPHVKGLRLQINSQHTGSTAESYFADLVFRIIAQ
jgi:Protein of unknown function (DUF3047)